MSRNKKKSSKRNKAVQTAGVNKEMSTVDKREAKKAAVLGTDKKNYRPLFAVITCAVVVAGAIFFLINGVGGKGNYQVANPPQSASNQSLTELTYPVAHFEDGNARHYEYRAANMTIKYFILKSSDGIIRAAYDACDVCWRAGKGYYQAGDYMVCRNCGRQFASVLVNEVKGGCNPAPLNRSIVNDNVVIKVKDILEGSQFFNFSGKV